MPFICCLSMSVMAPPMRIVALDALKSLVFHRFGMKKGFRISPKTLKAESEGFEPSSR